MAINLSNRLSGSLPLNEANIAAPNFNDPVSEVANRSISFLGTSSSIRSFTISRPLTSLQEAIASGDIETVKKLLEAKEITVEHLKLGLEKAASQRHEAIVKILLLKMIEIDQEHYTDAICFAIAYGFENIAQLFLESEPSSTDEFYEQGLIDAFNCAACSNYLGVVRLLLEKKSTLFYPEILSQIFKEVAANNCLSAVRYFLESELISIIDREDLNFERGRLSIKVSALRSATLSALDNGFVKILRLLLSRKISISQQYLESCAESVADSGNLKLFKGFKCLLSEGRTISSECLRKAIKSAANNNHVKVLRFFWSIAQEIEESDLQFVITSASINGFTNILEFILSKGIEISEANLSLVFTNAAYYGHMKIFKLFLSKGTILSSDNLGNCIVSAVQRGQIKVIRFLLSERRTVSSEYLCDALNAVSQNGRSEKMLNLLWSFNTARSEEELRNIFNYAIDKAYLNVIKFLFSKKIAIRRDDLLCALIISAQHHHIAVLRTLLSFERIATLENLSLIIEEVINNCDSEIVQCRSRVVRELLEIIRLDPSQKRAAIYGLGQQIIDAASSKEISIYPITMRNHPEYYLFQAKWGFTAVKYLYEDRTEQQGVDLGGLTKNFIHDLLDNLFLREILKRDDQLFPIADQSKKLQYCYLGQLISFLYKTNQDRSDPIYIGEIFNPKTFLLLSVLCRPRSPDQTEDQRKMEDVIAIAKEVRSEDKQILVEFLTKESPSKEDITKITEYFKTLSLIDEDKEATLKDLKTVCLENFYQYYDALEEIIRGLSQEFKAELIQNPHEMIEIVLGKGPTLERILAKINNSADFRVQQKISWIKNKIASEIVKPDSTWVKRFLKCITGQPVIPAKEIVIRGISYGNFCRAHTCNNTLDVPFGLDTPHIRNETFSDEERFIANLELTMAHTSFEIS